MQVGPVTDVPVRCG